MANRPLVKVLIVEDQADVRDTIRLGLRTIRQFKFEFVEAVHGKDGMRCLKSRYTPDLIIADLMMPEMDGFTFIKTVKQEKKYQYIPIIVLSAKSSGEDISRALQLGAIDYLFKPFEYEDLSRIVRNIEIGLQLKTADKVHSLKEQLEDRQQEWETIRALEVSRVFKVKKTDNILSLCGLFTIYFPKDKRNVLYMGLNEIILNAIVHGNLELPSAIKDKESGSRIFKEKIKEREKLAPYKDREVTVTLAQFSNSIQIDVLDQGLGFDPSDLKNSAKDPESLLSPHGRGITMTKFAFDVVEFDFPEQGGTQATLITRLT